MGRPIIREPHLEVFTQAWLSVLLQPRQGGLQGTQLELSLKDTQRSMCVTSLLDPQPTLTPEPWPLLQALQFLSPHLFLGPLLGSPRPYQEWIPSAPGQ